MCNQRRKINRRMCWYKLKPDSNHDNLLLEKKKTRVYVKTVSGCEVFSGRV